MPRIAVLLIAAFSCIAIAACNKDNKPKPTPGGGNNNPGGGTDTTAKADSAQVYFHLHTYTGSTEVDAYNIVYELDNGRKISLSKAQFYLSHIKMNRTDGTVYEMPAVVILKTFETQAYMVAKVPVGTYKSVSFSVGLDATTNQSAPNADMLNHPEMWFGSSAQPDGYIYANVQGKIDTTTDGDGTNAQMQPFVYKLGTDANYKVVNMADHPKPYTLTKDQVEYVHIIVDYSKLLTGVQLNNATDLMVNTKADNAGSLAKTITNNIPGMFSYEE